MASVGRNVVRVMPSGASTRARITSANGFLSTSCSARPASEKPEFEYEKARPGGRKQYSFVQVRW